MNQKTCLLLNLFITLMGLLGVAQAQDLSMNINKQEQSEVIDSISEILKTSYVFPEIAEQIVQHLEKQERAGMYAKTSDPREFAELLTNDVRSINNDLHLRVMFSPKQNQQIREAVTAEDSLAYLEQQIREAKKNNFGFQKIEFLDGNIGYLNLTGFSDTEYGAETATAAMNYLSNSDALIIDLRQNGGGSPKMIQLISSYLFDPEPVHLNNFYWRPGDRNTQTWTLPYVPGNRMPDVPVYVLTSKMTFSAAEEFSYNLRNLERATLVGETTGGGAHPGGTRIATDRYSIWVPSGRAINPITNDNWEGVGVKPHIEVPADQALDKAHAKALKQLIKNNTSGDNFHYEWALEGLEASQNELTLSKETMQSYVGNYGPRMIMLEEGKLYYQREGRGKYELIPMTTSKFRIEEIPYFRIQMLIEDEKVVGLEGQYNNGRIDKNIKDIHP